MKVLLSLSALVGGLFAASLLIGPAGLGLGESLAALLTGKGEALVLVMREIRLPRAILGALVLVPLGGWVFARRLNQRDLLR